MAVVRVLIVDDDELARKNLAQILKKDGYRITTAAAVSEAIPLLEKNRYDLVLADLVLEDGGGLEILEAAKRQWGDTEIIIVTGYASLDSAIEAMKKGAYHYLQKPFHMEEVRNLAARAVEKSSLRRQLKEMEEQLQKSIIIGKSAPIRHIVQLIHDVGPTDANVLVTGESGTGKELVAYSIHQHSRRASLKFLAINCASFTEELLANELFGHEKEAYSGAVSTRIGLLESADGGTVFFDEVADMPLSMQAKVLRVIQERELIRVGGTKAVAVDIRIIAATNKDLKKLISLGLFRQDLYYRLNVVPIHVPPLAERKSDIPLLGVYFLAKFARRMNKQFRGFSDAALDLLMRYDYPGNVRELENVLERAAALCHKDIIDVYDLPQDLVEVLIYRHDREQGQMKTLELMERDYIQWVLRKVGHNKSEAARILGIDRVSLYRKLKKYELSE